MNRADPVLLEYMKYHIDNVDPSKGETYEKAKKFGQILIDNCELFFKLKLRQLSAGRKGITWAGILMYRRGDG